MTNKALHELTIDELLKAVSTNKATGEQKLHLSKLLAEAATKEVEEEKAGKIQKVDEFIVSLGLKVEDYIKVKKSAATANSNEIIFEFVEAGGTKHVKYKGQKGQWPSKAYITANLTKQKALEHAKGDEGKKFVEKLYAA